MSQAERSVIVGETVHLHVRVSEPGTKRPEDPATVSITSFKRDGTSVVLAEPDFSRYEEGDWRLIIPTAGLTVGVYTLVVTIADGTSKVVKVSDRFTLQSE